MRLKEEFSFWRSRRPDRTDDEAEDGDSGASAESCSGSEGSVHTAQEGREADGGHADDAEHEKRRRVRPENGRKKKLWQTRYTFATASSSTSSSQSQSAQALISFAWALYWQEFLDMKVQCQSARQRARDLLFRSGFSSSLSSSQSSACGGNSEKKEEEQNGGGGGRGP